MEVIIVIAIFAAALVYLIVIAWRRFKGGGRCTACCSSCSPVCTNMRLSSQKKDRDATSAPGTPHKADRRARSSRKTQNPNWPFRLGLAALLVLVAVAMGIWHYIASRAGSAPERVPLQPSLVSEQYRQTMHRQAAIILSRYLAAHYTGRHALVIMPPESVATAEDRVIISVLQDRLQEKMELSVAKPAAQKEAAPGLWLTAAALDTAVRNHPEADVVVSIAGLPVNERELTFWREEPRPDLVLFNTSVLLLRKMIAAGAVDAVLVRRPWREGTPLDLPPEDERHWLLITSENVDNISKQYPTLFFPEKDRHAH